jgi:hypothetical protein
MFRIADGGAPANTGALYPSQRARTSPRTGTFGPLVGPFYSLERPLRTIFRDPLPLGTIQEGSRFTLSVSFWDDAAEPWTAFTPTTISYRVDCLTTGCVLREWTTLTPAASTSISLTSADNTVNDSYNQREGRQVTVKVNSGLSTQSQDTFTYYVANNGAI